MYDAIVIGAHRAGSMNALWSHEISLCSRS